jgi:catechol 2,3-dioxygenase-like lactoylglutathione lyase family enzyme
MKIKAVNHICVVATDLDKTRGFLENLIGCTPHPAMESWFRIPDQETTIHVIDIEDADVPSEDELFHYYRHTAFEVDDLREICNRALTHGYVAFQMDVEGEEEIIENPDSALNFGLKTVFVRDPDGNLWEFAQRGHSWDKLWE